MRRSTLGGSVLALAMVLGATRLPAQGFMIGGGASLPTGDFGKFAKTGWAAMAGVDIPMGSKSLAIRIDGDYSSNSSKTTGAGSEKIWAGFGGVQFGLGSGNTAPYLVGQVGYMKPDCTGCGGAFAWAGGAGVAMGSIFLEGRYASASKNGSTTSMIYAEIGLKFGGKKK